MNDHPIIVQNLNNPNIAPIQARWCESFLSRLQGFTFRKSLEQNEGLVLVEKRDTRIDTSIHMMFVWTDLTVIWINSEMTVVDVILAKQWYPIYIPSHPARYTLEIHPSRLNDFKAGDKVQFKNA